MSSVQWNFTPLSKGLLDKRRLHDITIRGPLVAKNNLRCIDASAKISAGEGPCREKRRFSLTRELFAHW